MNISNNSSFIVSANGISDAESMTRTSNKHYLNRTSNTQSTAHESKSHHSHTLAQQAAIKAQKSDTKSLDDQYVNQSPKYDRSSNPTNHPYQSYIAQGSNERANEASHKGVDGVRGQFVGEQKLSYSAKQALSLYHSTHGQEHRSLYSEYLGVDVYI